MLYADDDERWQAVATNDGDADGSFVYAVATTGVYCRPSCRSRRPNRENVRFFETAQDAREAGFRPCKACRPDELFAPDRDTALVEAVCRRIEAADAPLSLDDLAEDFHLSPSHLRRVFRAVTGVTPKQYAGAARAGRLRGLLSGAIEGGPDAQRSISSAIYAAGFESGSRVYATAARTLGMTPSAMCSGGAGEAIRFAVAPCYLGLVLIAATDRGLCAVEFGDSPEALRETLRQRFPRARIVENDPGFSAWVAATLAYIETPSRGLDLPLDIQGTAFQRLVSDALREIPVGTTSSYTQVAARIGRPSSARAVARACASNHLAVVVPCHRVVRANGDVSGYRWGIDRKRAILARERDASGR